MSRYSDLNCQNWVIERPGSTPDPQFIGTWIRIKILGWIRNRRKTECGSETLVKHYPYGIFLIHDFFTTVNTEKKRGTLH
jgi:hypothetical protein